MAATSVSLQLLGATAPTVPARNVGTRLPLDFKLRRAERRLEKSGDTGFCMSACVANWASPRFTPLPWTLEPVLCLFIFSSDHRRANFTGVHKNCARVNNTSPVGKSDFEQRSCFYRWGQWQMTDDRYRKSFLPSTITLFNTSVWQTLSPSSSDMLSV